MNNESQEFRFDDVRCVVIETITAINENNPLEIVHYLIDENKEIPVKYFNNFPNCNAVRVKYDEEGYLKDVCLGYYESRLLPEYGSEPLSKRFTCHYRVIYKNLIYSEDGSCKLIGIKIDENLKNWTAQNGIDFDENDLKLNKKILS